MTILRNMIRCTACNTIAESTYRHHYALCECGKVAADGGKAYLRRAFPGKGENEYEELSTYVDGEGKVYRTGE